MTKTTSSLNQRSSSSSSSSSSMQVDSLQMPWDNTDHQIIRTNTADHQPSKNVNIYDHHHHHHHQDYYNYTMSNNCENKASVDSLIVPDEDDFHFDFQHHHNHHLQVAPRVAHHQPQPVTRTHVFDLNHDLNDDDDDAALSMMIMINSKTSACAAERLDYTDLVVPHQHDDSELDTASPKPKLGVISNSAEPAALVPSLSVCSNDLPCDPRPATTRDHQHQHNQSGEEEQSQHTLTNKVSTLAKRKSGTTKVQTVYKKKRKVVKIDKKLQTLQRLIPNCNGKVDKASILDDAIVYMKTLQLQLQMMSMPFPMIGFPPFVALPPPPPPSLLLPHPSISMSASINAHRYPNFSAPTFQ